MMRIKGRTGFPANSFSLEKNAGESGLFLDWRKSTSTRLLNKMNHGSHRYDQRNDRLPDLRVNHVDALRNFV